MVEPSAEPQISIALITSSPSRAFPKTTCFPSSQGVSTVVMKNCDLFVFGPELAHERVPA